MLNILRFILDLLEQHVIWLYLLCLILIIYNLRIYMLAHRDRTNTVFTIEKEIAAHREGQAMSTIGAVLGLVAIITALKYYVMPTIDVEQLVEPTPTFTLIAPTQTPSPTPEPATPTPTTRPRPTQEPVVSTPAPTVVLLPTAQCSDPNTQISYPRMGEAVSGVITLEGTASHAQFQFYKIEFGVGAEPSQWSVIGDLYRSPVVGGALGQFDTTVVPNGQYSIRITVVDQTGNYPPPCQVSVNIEN